jgi:hypothetical protein
MIDPNYIEVFKEESIKYNHLEEKVKNYIESRYCVSLKRAISVYSVRVGFQMVIGNIPQSVLAYWLHKWGYKVEPSKGENTDGSHSVYICIKPLVSESNEKHYLKEWARKRKGSVVF